MNEQFKADVLAWMTTSFGGPRCMDATEVLDVRPHGSDWAGDTMSGFHNEFSVEIRYRESETTRWMDVDGERLESLWRWLMSDPDDRSR